MSIEIILRLESSDELPLAPRTEIRFYTPGSEPRYYFIPEASPEVNPDGSLTTTYLLEPCAQMHLDPAWVAQHNAMAETTPGTSHEVTPWVVPDDR